MRHRDLIRLAEADLQEQLTTELARWILAAALDPHTSEAPLKLRQLATEYLRRREHGGVWCACESCFRGWDPDNGPF